MRAKTQIMECAFTNYRSLFSVLRGGEPGFGTDCLLCLGPMTRRNYFEGCWADDEEVIDRFIGNDFGFAAPIPESFAKAVKDIADPHKRLSQYFKMVNKKGIELRLDYLKAESFDKSESIDTFRMIIRNVLGKDALNKAECADGMSKFLDDCYQALKKSEIAYKEITLDDLKFADLKLDKAITTTAQILAGVTEIIYGAFKDCTALASVTIPTGVTKICEDAFKGCSSLQSVVIPEGVTEIGWEAFYGCASLSSITIPTSFTKIGNWAFQDCPSLKKS